MSFTSFRAGAALAATLMLTPALAMATGITITDSYVRSSAPGAPTGAAFMLIENNTDQDDRLLGVSSDVAKKTQLHTHIEDANGVARMTHIEGGIALPAGETHLMKRGGDHVMLMGIVEPLVQGEEITVTFTFEQAGDVKVAIPVDHERTTNPAPVEADVDATN